jgi:hypothetical protein
LEKDGAPRLQSHRRRITDVSSFTRYGRAIIKNRAVFRPILPGHSITNEVVLWPEIAAGFGVLNEPDFMYNSPY